MSSSRTSVETYWVPYSLDLTHHYMIPRSVGAHRKWYETSLYFQAFFFALLGYPESLPSHPLTDTIYQGSYPLALSYHEAVASQLPASGGDQAAAHAPLFEQYPFCVGEGEVLPYPQNRLAKGRRQAPEPVKPQVSLFAWVAVGDFMWAQLGGRGKSFPNDRMGHPEAFPRCDGGGKSETSSMC